MKATLYDYENGEFYDATDLFDPELPRRVYGIMRDSDIIDDIITDVRTTTRISFFDPRASHLLLDATLPGFTATVRVSSGNVIIDNIVLNGIRLLSKTSIRNYLVENGFPPEVAATVAELLKRIEELVSMEKRVLFERILGELRGVV